MKYGSDFTPKKRVTKNDKKKKQTRISLLKTGVCVN